jgi:hypothetical protein
LTAPSSVALDGEIEFRAAGTGGSAGLAEADSAVSASAAPGIVKRALRSLGG